MGSCGRTYQDMGVVGWIHGVCNMQCDFEIMMTRRRMMEWIKWMPCTERYMNE